MSNTAQEPLADSQDEFIFAQEDDAIAVSDATALVPLGESWKILIVDDEIEVHEVTKLALSDFTFENKALTFISAYSAQDAKQLIQAHSDTAIVFLDVVMETENAGLQVIQYIREELGNSLVRIILRTGQPGQAPETAVVTTYSIDDYKTKTELTAQKLFITVITALRAFSTLMQMLEISQGLKLDLLRYQQAAATLELSEIQEQEHGDPLERSLDLQPTPLKPKQQHEKIELLGQLVAEVAHDMMHPPNAGALYTMSMITRIARIVLRLTDEHSAKLGLSQSKLTVLMYLHDEPERCASPSLLAKHCGVSRAAMTGLLNGLEQEGYVERDEHPSDRRALRVKLTVKGQQFLDWIQSQGQSQKAKLMDTLDEVERQKFIDLARTVLTLFEDHSKKQITE